MPLEVIDLTDANADTLRKNLEEYVTHARRTGGRIKRGAGAGSATASHEQAQAIREWHAGTATRCRTGGRIAANITEAFEAAQSEASAKTRKRRSKASASS